jgi:hypothetical protein
MQASDGTALRLRSARTGPALFGRNIDDDEEEDDADMLVE